MTGNVNNNVGVSQNMELDAIAGVLDSGKIGERVKSFAAQFLSYVQENVGEALDESPKLPAPKAGASQPSIMQPFDLCRLSARCGHSGQRTDRIDDG